MLKRLFVLSTLILLTSCYQPRSQAYKEMYSHLQCPCRNPTRFTPTEYFLVILVDARHLDYTDCRSFISTVAKHPSDMSKTGDVGHAWIFLQGKEKGIPMYLEGGFSGDRGFVEPQYFDGIMNYNDFGYANPTPEQCENPIFEPNPSKYLFQTLSDGFFQWGPGIHRPSYAAKINISPEQYESIKNFIAHYDYEHYALTGNQCSSYVTQLCEIIGLHLDAFVALPIDPILRFGKEPIRLWEDPQYAVLPLSSPDMLERSLMELVKEGKAEDALDWYKRTHRRPLSKRICCLGNTLRCFPTRYSKFMYTRFYPRD